MKDANSTDSKRRLPASMTFALAAAVLYFLVAFFSTAKVLMSPDDVFAFNDGNIEVALASYAQYPEGFFRRWNNQQFFGRGGGSAPITASNLLSSILGPHEFRRLGVLLTIWLTGLSGLWMFRQFNRSRPAAILCGVLLMLCGWTFSFPTVGLPVRSFTLAFAALSLGWTKRGIERSSIAHIAVAGGFLGLAVSDTPDVGIMFALSCATMFVVLQLHTHGVKETRRPKPLRTFALGLAVYVVMSLFVAYQTIGHQVGSNIKGVSQGTERTPQEKYEWATQWSLPPAETWSLFAPDYHGASSRSPESPYWGEMGRSAGWEESRQGFRNFRLAGYALGTVPLILLCFAAGALIRKEPDASHSKRLLIGSCFGLALITLMLSWGHHSPLYRLFYALPYMGTIRNPDKWLGPCTLVLTLLCAFGFDGLHSLLRQDDKTRALKVLRVTSAAAGVFGLIALADLLRLTLTKQLFLKNLKDLQFNDTQAGHAWQNAIQADTRFLIILIVSLGVIWVTYALREKNLRISSGVFLPAALGLLLCVDLGIATRPFVLAHSYKHILQENVLTRALNDVKDTGRVKLLPQNHALMNNWRLGYLAARGYDLFDPVSVSRMPDDHAAFFKAIGNDVTKLWGMGSVRHFVCLPQLAAQLKQLSRPGMAFAPRVMFGVTQDSKGHAIPSDSVAANQKVLALIEYEGALPFIYTPKTVERFDDSPEGNDAALKRIASPSFNYREAAVVQTGADASIPAGATAKLTTHERTPNVETLSVNMTTSGLLARTTHFDTRWTATIDGESTDLLRVNYLFQGIVVPEGEHDVTFTFTPNQKPLKISIAGRTLLIVLMALCMARRRTDRPARESGGA